MSNAPQPYFKVIYNTSNITEDISKSLNNITYVDNTGADADELTIVVDNADGRWSGDWRPDKGAKLTVEIGILGGSVLKCGVFTIDEFDVSGPPDIFSMKALAAGITKPVRTKRSYSHDNKKLRQIVQSIADRHGFEIIGNIPDVQLDYVYQNKETDLVFLSRLADDYGCTFNLRDNKLIFTDSMALESSQSAVIVDKTDVTSYAFNDKSTGTYTGADVKHYHQKNNEVVSGSASDDDFDGEDVDTIRVSATTSQQAEIKAKAALNKSNSREKTGSITMPLNVLLLAGNNFTASGFQKDDGIYHIETSTHTIAPQEGCMTAISFKKGATATKIKSSPSAYKYQDSFD